jgi:hypothetical protein
LPWFWDHWLHKILLGQSHSEQLLAVGAHSCSSLRSRIMEATCHPALSADSADHAAALPYYFVVLRDTVVTNQ